MKSTYELACAPMKPCNVRIPIAVMRHSVCPRHKGAVALKATNVNERILFPLKNKHYTLIIKIARGKPTLLVSL